MTSEMAFECVLASCDSDVLRTINRTLIDLAITTRICFHVSQAQRAIAQGSSDLVIIDLVDEQSMEFLREVWKLGLKQKPTIVGISSSDHSIPGVHIRLTKPVTHDSSLKALKAAYSRMVLDYRRHARHALLLSVTATDDFGRPAPITVTDIGYGGVGLQARHEMQIGQVLSFSLSLPGASRPIYIEARVLWHRDFGRTGCEFVRIPPVDLSVLHDWLKEKIVIKQPAVQV
jgi:PilZ domain